MDKKEKLIQKLLSEPKDFTFDEAVTLLGYFSYTQNNKGKTSGSRVAFSNPKTSVKIIMHKPHSRNVLLDYQVKQLIEQLKQEGLI